MTFIVYLIHYNKIKTSMVTKSKSSPAIISVTADAVIFTVEGGKLKVLLIKRSKAPFKDSWALPGGFIHKKETSLDAAKRILLDKAGIKNIYIEQLFTFDSLDRDPRGEILSISYFAFIRREQIKFVQNSKIQSPQLFNVKKLPKLAFDHAEIIKYALKRIRAKLEYTNIIYALLPKTFMFSQLQNVYEIVWDKELDKRNFRKKFMSLKLIRPLNKRSSGLRQRPAQLFSFVSKKPLELKKFF